MTNRTFNDTLRALTKALCANISWKRPFGRRGDTFRARYSESTIGYLVADVEKEYTSCASLDDESILSMWASQGAEIIGDGMNIPWENSFDKLREKLAADVAEGKDDCECDGSEWEHGEEEALLTRWFDTSEVGDFWFWFLSYYVEDALVDWTRDNAIDILGGNVTSPQDVAEESLDAFCRAWVRMVGKARS